MIAINLVAILAIGGLGYAGQKALRDYKGAKLVSVDSIKMPVTPVGMLGTVDEEGRLGTVSVLVLSAGTQVGGTIVSVPVSSNAGAVGAPPIPLTQVYAQGGVEALTTAMESLLSITFDVAAVAAPAEAETLFQPATPVKADLPGDVLGAGTDAPILFDAGANSLSAAQTVQALNAQAEGQTDAERRGNVQALFAGVAESIGPGRTTVDATAPIVTIGDVVSRLFAAPVAARGLPGSPIAAADNPDGLDAETLPRSDAIFVLASIAPGSMTAPSPDLVFRVEAPPGYEARVSFAVRALLFLGGNVVSVYISDSVEVHPEVRLYIDNPNLIEKVQSANELFGNTVTLTPDKPIEGIDVIVQLGTDFLTGEGDTLPGTTTSTTEPS